ncbi:MAG: peptidase T [Sediminibacterium sp.]|nr:peptidase T [Sediminibacterium sp.]MDP3665862.1 peptidase T [Sediminibacterium sp.]
MLKNYSFTVVERFLRYVQIDTQSNPQSNTYPSSEKQKLLSNLLANELLAMGFTDAKADEYGYVYATIPANTTDKVPVICFCSHIDTAPDCSGTGVKPILHERYDGSDIVLPDDRTQVIRLVSYPYLKEHIGYPIITASGLTLLGADDKAGVAEIMDMANYLSSHPGIRHGMIKILFTPDEEVGHGTAKLDLQKLGSNFAYTLDGGEMGSLEDETFSADGVTITINGVMAHPGYAKGKMVNALKIMGDILAALPKTQWCPEVTDGREGFVHALRMDGLAEKATIEFIVRDFDTAQLVIHETRLKNIAEEMILKYPGASMQFDVQEQYRNMKEVLDQYPKIIEYAEEAYKKVGISILKKPIRGGTDGSRLSFMGLPCPNLFTGMQAIHSKHEWVGVRDMEKAVEMLVALVQVVK